MTAEEFYNGILDFIENGNLNIVKKTKKGEKEMNLKPLIYEIHRVADGNGLFLQLSSGSAANVKPELVLEAYCKSLGKEYPQFAFRINREEVYADAGEHDFVTLESFGEKLENMLDKLIITALRGKTAAVLFKDGHAAQIDFEPEAAEEETGVIFVGKVKNISKNINAAFVEYRPGVNGFTA